MFTWTGIKSVLKIYKTFDLVVFKFKFVYLCFDMKIKILNLYGGIGGNRKEWQGDIDVTMVELNPDIAAVYKVLYPNDKVIVGDAHEYLLNNFQYFDFIWGSPPCPSHSRMRTLCVGRGQSKPVYIDCKLYQEIILRPPSQEIPSILVTLVKG